MNLVIHNIDPAMRKPTDFTDGVSPPDTSVFRDFDQIKPELPSIRSVFPEQSWSPFASVLDISSPALIPGTWTQNVGWYHYYFSDGDQHELQDTVNVLVAAMKKYFHTDDLSTVSIDQYENMFMFTNPRPMYPKVAPKAANSDKACKVAKANKVVKDKKKKTHGKKEKKRREWHRICQSLQGEICGTFLVRVADELAALDRQRRDAEDSEPDADYTEDEAKTTRQPRNCKNPDEKEPGKDEIHARCILSMLLSGMMVLAGRDARKTLEKANAKLRANVSEIAAENCQANAACYELRAENEELQRRLAQFMKSENDHQKTPRSPKRLRTEDTSGLSMPASKRMAIRSGLPSPILSSTTGSCCGDISHDHFEMILADEDFPVAVNGKKSS